MAGLYDPEVFNFLPPSMEQTVAPPVISAPGFYSPNNFNGTGIPYSQEYGGFGALQAGASPNATGSFGQKYNSFMGKYGQSIGQGISAAGALFNLYGGIKSLGLMEKQYKLAKKTTRLGVDNAAIAGNNQIAHHTTATQNSGGPYKGAVYTPFKGWDG